jgi:hypothetical protein
MIYILVNGHSANVFTVLACAQLFHSLEGGELFAVDLPYSTVSQL